MTVIGKEIAERYLIEEEIGAGGMGIVYRGFDTQTQMAVAIKQLKPELNNPELIERFEREGEALRDLNHPNIVKLLDTVKHEGAHYLVMEYVAGGDLHSVIKAGQLSIKLCLKLALQLADALTRAHYLYIIHRDLKPANVLLAEDDTLRLTDFGVAHMVDKERLTDTNALVGTLDYLPPEMLQGEAIDTRADIWAFGVMLFEMLTGDVPFKANSPAHLIMNIVTQTTPDLEELRPDVPIDLIELIYQMLEKDRNERIRSVRQVGAEIEAIIQGYNTSSTDSILLQTRRVDTPIPRPIQLEQRIYFTKSFDGTQIAYATMGEGYPIVRAAHFLTHLEYDLRSPVWKHWLEELSRENTFIRYDERGSGMSDRSVEHHSLDAWVHDLEAVVDDLGLEKFALMGASQSGAVAIDYAVRHPERVSHLILYGTYLLGGIVNASEEYLAQRELNRNMIKIGWGHDNSAFLQYFAADHIPDAPSEIYASFTELMRVSASAEDAIRLMDTMGILDVREIAPQITVPTLILQLRDDINNPFEDGREVATAIPKAQFVALEGRNHIMLRTDAAWPKFITEVRRFLAKQPTI